MHGSILYDLFLRPNLRRNKQGDSQQTERYQRNRRQTRTIFQVS
jgi:hypothetical protein